MDICTVNIQLLQVKLSILLLGMGKPVLMHEELTLWFAQHQYSMLEVILIHQISVLSFFFHFKMPLNWCIGKRAFL